MAYGTLKADVIQSDTAGTPPQFNDGNGTQTGTLCRAWVNFNGNTAAIRGSFNVSSVTRNSAGDYRVNFTNALIDANFSAYAMNMDGGAGFRTYSVVGNGYASTYFQFVVLTTAPTYADPTTCGVAIFR
jgi:hypothetical protein